MQNDSTKNSGIAFFICLALISVSSLMIDNIEAGNVRIEKIENMPITKRKPIARLYLADDMTTLAQAIDSTNATKRKK